MNIWETRLNFRPRNGWEALDLGTRLFQECPFLYMGLWAVYSLPFYGLLMLVFWRQPALAGFLIWLFKPVFEAPLLQLMSRQVFEELPGFSGCLKSSWRSLWRPRLIGDLTWRRLSIRRSLVLPLTVLEGLGGKAWSRRSSELSRRSSAMAGWLTFVGIHIEMILSFGLLLLGIWLWWEDPTSTFFGNPFTNLRAWNELGRLFETLFVTDDGIVVNRISNLIYVLVLCFWQPIYVSSGFSLYLNSRTLAEGWDIRLAARKIQERLTKSKSALWALLPLVFVVFALSGSLKAQAEPLPDEQKIERIKENELSSKPFPRLEKETKWVKKDQKYKPPELDVALPKTKAKAPVGVNMLIYLIAALALGGVLFLLWRWSAHYSGKLEGVEVPDTLFGMKITPESLPDDVAGEVLRLFERDPRAALSLLYRGSLSQVARRYGIPLRSSDTEGEVLRRIERLKPELSAYWRLLTTNWVALAYAHWQPDREAVHSLCRDYRRLFALAEGEGSLKNHKRDTAGGEA